MPQLGDIQLGESQLASSPPLESVLSAGGAAITINDVVRTPWVMARTRMPSFELTIGERGTSRVVFGIQDGSWEPQIGQQLAWFDGTGTRRFVGSIDAITPTRMSRVADGWYYECQIVSLEQRLDKRFIVTTLFEDMTDGEIVRFLIREDAAYNEGVIPGTIEPGELRERVVIAEKTSVWQFIQQRAALNGFVAYVDSDNRLQFGPASSRPSPFTIDDSVIFWEGHSIEYDRSDLRTRQHVRFADSAVPPERDVIEGDSESDSYTVRHNIRQILSITLTTATQASQTGSFSGVPSDGDTITIGAFVYTFKNAVDNLAGQQVQIGANASDCAENLKRAINGLTDNPVTEIGTVFSLPTVAHFGVIAERAGTQITIKSKFCGAWVNGEEPVSTTSGAFSWDGAALEGGEDGGEDGGEMQLTFSEDGDSEDAQWTYIPGTTTITKGPVPTTGFIWPGLSSFGANSPAIGERLVIEYRPLNFNIVTLQDDAAVAARAAAEGISGIYEHLLDRGDLTDRNMAIVAGLNELENYGTPSITLAFGNRFGGLLPGQLATVSSTDLGLSDTFIIERVSGEFRGCNESDGYIRYGVRCISGGKARAWIKTWEALAKKAAQPPQKIPNKVHEMRVATFILGNERGPVELFELENTNTPMVKHPGIAVSWDAIAMVAPVGDDIIIDILKNGESIFGVSGPKVVIPDGSTSKESGTVFGGVIELNTGDTLEAVVDQIGISEPGRGVTVQLYWRQ